MPQIGRKGAQPFEQQFERRLLAGKVQSKLTQVRATRFKRAGGVGVKPIQILGGYRERSVLCVGCIAGTHSCSSRSKLSLRKLCSSSARSWRWASRASM